MAWIQQRPLLTRYIAAILLAITVPGLPILVPVAIPLVLYAPFMVVSAIALGLGPGLLAAFLCILEAIYFAIQSAGSFAAIDPASWDVVAFLGLTGLFASLMAERLKWSVLRPTERRHRITAILQNISNWELRPHDSDSLFGVRSHMEEEQAQLQLLESAMLQSSDGVLILKVSGHAAGCQKPVFMNAAFERTTGFNLDDVRQGALTLPCSPWETPDGIERPGSFCHQQLEGLALHKDGTQFWAEWGFHLLAAKDGIYTHCVWTCRDITERKRTEEAAHLFTAIVEASGDAILSETLDGTVLTWNKGAERIYGYSSEEMVGQSVARLMLAGGDDELPNLMDDLRRGARISHYETWRVRKDGRRILVSLSMSPIRNSRNHVIGASVIARDITDRKSAERALALSEERYRSLAFATAQIVWSTGLEGEVIEDVPMWRAFTGQSLEEATGMGWIFALHPEDRERTADVWLRTVRNRTLYDTECRIRRHDGEYRWMEVHGVPVLEADGAIREWVITCADMHNRKRAEEEIRKLNQELEQRVVERTAELEAANQELEAFAYSVSHDLRAPLRAVSGFSRILLEEYAPRLPAKAQHYLEAARKNAVQMGELIDDLLAFSRLSRQPLHKQPIAPAELVRQVLQDLRPDREGRQVEITVGDLPGCEGDPRLLKQVLVNLLSNGFKYTRTREVARIEVGAMTPSGGATPVYYVRDNGVGFDMRYADKLFGVFQRLHGTREYPGTGVGLAIVQRIVHRHGGRVWAEAAVNQGATFYFVLGQGRPRQTKEELETCPINP
jgi:PAS domain S-box-containing protein